MHYAADLFGLSASFAAVFAVIILLVFIFEVAMFVDAWRNSALDSTARLFWLVGMLFIHPFIAILYYFTDRNKP